MIHVVDYGLGNIQAFNTMFMRLGFESVRARTPKELQGATKVILPGVGAFDHAMTLLHASGMRPVLENLVGADEVPVLGICVGMQILANGSDEGIQRGLGWVEGHVRNFAGNPSSAGLPLPHMGWNDIEATPGSALFEGLENARFYFLHSYYFDCANREQSCAQADYGFKFDCSVQKNNIFGVQFHPEKSHHWGAALLRNFASL